MPLLFCSLLTPGASERGVNDNDKFSASDPRLLGRIVRVGNNYDFVLISHRSSPRVDVFFLGCSVSRRVVKIFYYPVSDAGVDCIRPPFVVSPGNEKGKATALAARDSLCEGKMSSRSRIRELR